jgi:hypothetical protein
MSDGTAPAELLADTRDAFQHLEDAISSSDPARCRTYVSDQLYHEVVSKVADLSAHGRWRVHGSFEILDAAAVSGESSAEMRVRIHAISSIMEVDDRARIVAGSADLMSWRQDVTAEHSEAAVGQPQWILGELGEMAVERVITGPAQEPMDPELVRSLELRRLAREQEAAERFARLHHVHVNMLTYLQVGSGV